MHLSIDKTQETIFTLGKYLMSNADVVDRFDMSYGFSGFAHFFYYKYKLSGSHADLLAYYECTERSIQLANNGTENGFEFIDLTEFHYYLNSHYQQLESIFDISSLIPQLEDILLSFSRDAIQQGNLDPYTGGFRQAYFLLEQHKHPDFHASLIRDMYHGKIDLDSKASQLGIAHGLAFYLLFAIRCFEKGIAADTSALLMKRICEKILACRQAYDQYGAFFFDKIGINGHSRLNLCYGDAHIIYMLLRAGKLLQNDHLQQQALDMLQQNSLRKSTKQTGITDNSILYGKSGIYLYYSALCSHQLPFESTRLYWKEEYLRELMIADISDMPALLYYGIAETKRISLLEGITGPLSIYMAEKLGMENDLAILTHLI